MERRLPAAVAEEQLPGRVLMTRPHARMYHHPLIMYLDVDAPPPPRAPSHPKRERRDACTPPPYTCAPLARAGVRDVRLPACTYTRLRTRVFSSRACCYRQALAPQSPLSARPLSKFALVLRPYTRAVAALGRFIRRAPDGAYERPVAPRPSSLILLWAAAVWQAWRRGRCASPPGTFSRLSRRSASDSRRDALPNLPL